VLVGGSTCIEENKRFSILFFSEREPRVYLGFGFLETVFVPQL
jgi:hypothetical protein